MKITSFYKAAALLIVSCLVNNALLAQKTTLSGTVRTSNEVLISATVSIANQTIQTDRNGQFSLPIAPGTYVIVITHTGYKTIERNINISANQERDVDFEMMPDDLLEEITLMGSKTGTLRSNLYTAVPIDVIPSARLVQTGQPSLIQMLNYTLPSLNAERQKIWEPVTYRGMDPDHLLILLNNTRYHNAAWLNNGTPKSNLGRGSTGNDLSTIPFFAIDKIEMLRDGASAQYGSDAISGVLNVRLKEETGKTLVNANIGQFYDGDGFKSWIGVYRGFRLKNKNLPASRQGFISFSAEVRTQAPTTRAGEYNGLVYQVYRNGMSAADSARVKSKDDSTILANNLNQSAFSSNNGNSKLASAGLLINGAYPINDHLKLFWTGTVNYRKNHFWGTYHYPKDTAQVNKFVHPHGFKPIVTSGNWDVTAIAGIKGIAKNNWSWEISSSLGNNTNKLGVENTNNASQQILLEEAAPTSFYLGTLIYNLLNNNISFTKALSNNSSRTSKFIIGAEWRFENYEQRKGDEAATKDYDLTGPKQGGVQPSIGSVSSSDAINKSRSVSSLYADLEFEPNDHLLIDIASRYEYFSDFGSNLSGKLAIRYRFSPKFSIRSSISNGYRAPALQQRYFSGIQTFRGTTQIQRVFNNESEITKAFHIPSLTAEKAVTISSGFTSRLSPAISFTIDGYFIQIKNRIVLSGVFRITDPQVAAILANHPGIDFVQFYTNAINTKTYGADLVLNGYWKIQRTNIGLTIAANINRHTIFGEIKHTDVVTNISNYTNTLFGIEEKTTLKRDQPGEKIILSATITTGKFSFVMRNTFFGSTASATIVTNPTDTLYDFFSSRILTDCSISYAPIHWLTITLGANNIFNVYPDRLRNDRTEGISLYSNGSIPYGTNGGYYYLNMRLQL